MPERLFEQTIYIFKQVNVERKFSTFTFTELKWEDVNLVYCNKQEILKIDGLFWMFSGTSSNLCNQPKKAIIRFKARAKVMKELIA